MNVTDVLLTIPRGSLRSYTWVAVQLGYRPGAARAAGRRIAAETLRRWPTAEAESDASETAVSAYPWWRVVGRTGQVRTARETAAWCERQILRLEAEGNEVVASITLRRARLRDLPADFV
jgi:alkylated DNA nucleotide flippase Atl1